MLAALERLEPHRTKRYPVGCCAMDVVTVGDVMIDVRVDSDGLEEGGDVHGRVLVRPGGSAANAAVWAAEVGARARVHGRIGSDVAGALLRDELIARGVEPALAIDPSADTGTMLVVHEPARALDGGGPRRRRAPGPAGPARTARGGRRPRLRLLAAVRADLGGRRGGARTRPRAVRRGRRGVVADDPLVRRGPVLRVVHAAPRCSWRTSARRRSSRGVAGTPPSTSSRGGSRSSA